MNTFTFKTREEYFEYKTEWKEKYFAISKEIRKAALERRDTERAFSKAYPFYGRSPEDRAIYFAANKAQWAARDSHKALKAQATAALKERLESRAEAGRQMQANKVTV